MEGMFALASTVIRYFILPCIAQDASEVLMKNIEPFIVMSMHGPCLTSIQPISGESHILKLFIHSPLNPISLMSLHKSGEQDVWFIVLLPDYFVPVTCADSVREEIFGRQWKVCHKFDGPLPKGYNKVKVMMKRYKVKVDVSEHQLGQRLFNLFFQSIVSI